MRLRLAVAAHRAVDEFGFSAAQERPGRELMERTFAPGENVWMPVFEAKMRAAIMKHDTSSTGDDAGTETHVEALDERHRAAFAVDGDDCDRAARIDG